MAPEIRLHRQMRKLTQWAGDNPVTITQCAEYWGILYPAASARLRQAAKLGIPCPQIARLRGQWKRPLAPTKYDGDDCIVADLYLGNKRLPICPVCLKANRRGKNGETVHLTQEGDYRYCLRCGYDPQFERAREAQYRKAANYHKQTVGVPG